MIRILIAALLVLFAAPMAQAQARVHHHYAHAGYYGPRYGSHYTNVDGNSVHSPMHAHGRPVGATAHCGDGTWSFSQHHSGTCSHHGGVSSWAN